MAVGLCLAVFVLVWQWGDGCAWCCQMAGCAGSVASADCVQREVTDA